MRKLTPDTQPHELFDFFASKRRRKLKSVEWLTHVLLPICRQSKRERSGGVIRLLQHPREFARFLVLLGNLGARSYIEIGTHSGGSLFVTDSYLRALDPAAFVGSVGVDISDRNLVGWSAYVDQFPRTRFILSDSRKLDLGAEQFVAGLIDGAHTVRAVANDFGILREHCRVVAFHDIAAKKINCARIWRQVKERHSSCPIWEFISLPPRRKLAMGLGIIQMTERPAFRCDIHDRRPLPRPYDLLRLEGATVE